MGGDVSIRNASGSSSITLGSVLESGGTLTVDATNVRLTGDLQFASTGIATAPTNVTVANTASIQDAIDIAGVGATITLDAGTFHERGILLDKRVEIVGQGKDAATGSVIDANPMAPGYVGRSSALNGLVVAAGGIDAANALSLQNFAVANAALNGIAVNRGLAGNTLRFIDLTNIASTMNGNDGLLITGSGTATDLAFAGIVLTMNKGDGLGIDGGTVRRLSMQGDVISTNSGDGLRVLHASIEDLAIDHVAIASNGEDGIHIEQSDISDFTIQNAHVGQAPNGSSIFIGNQRDGFRAENSTLTGLAFLDSFFNGNGADGIGILVSVIESGPVTLHDPSMRITTGFTLRNLQSIGNDNGIDFNGDTASDVTIKNAVIAENRSDGIVIVTTDNVPSSFTDLVIQDSAIGAAPNPLGGVFIGNGADGFHAEVTTFTGVAFLDSSFNGNGVRLNGADGIVFGTSTISTGPITLDGGTQIAGAGFTFENSQAVRNTGNGVQFNTVTASDISFRSDIIADNELDGILIQDKDPGEGAVSSITDLLIQDSYLGAAPNPLGGTFAANRATGLPPATRPLPEWASLIRSLTATAPARTAATGFCSSTAGLMRSRWPRQAPCLRRSSLASGSRARK